MTSNITALVHTFVPDPVQTKNTNWDPYKKKIKNRKFIRTFFTSKKEQQNQHCDVLSCACSWNGTLRSFWRNRSITNYLTRTCLRAWTFNKSEYTIMSSPTEVVIYLVMQIRRGVSTWLEALVEWRSEWCTANCFYIGWSISDRYTLYNE